MPGEVVPIERVTESSRSRVRTGRVKQPRSLRRTVIRHLRVLAISCAAFAIGFGFTSLVGGPASPAPQPATTELVGETGDATMLIEKFDYWVGEAPAHLADQMPGHVIATPRDAVSPVRGGEAMVGRAFDQLFDGIDHGITVHAFCR